MTALHRAVALAEREDVTVRVGEQLHLDVAGSLEVALEVDAVVAEGSLRLSLRGVDRLVEVAARSRTMRMPRPPPPAADLTISGGSASRE